MIGALGMGAGFALLAVGIANRDFTAGMAGLGIVCIGFEVAIANDRQRNPPLSPGDRK